MCNNKLYNRKNQWAENHQEKMTNKSPVWEKFINDSAFNQTISQHAICSRTINTFTYFKFQ